MFIYLYLLILFVYCPVDVIVPLIQSSNVNLSDINNLGSTFEQEQLQDFGRDVIIIK